MSTHSMQVKPVARHFGNCGVAEYVIANGPLDDFDGEVEKGGLVRELGAVVGAIGEQVLEPGPALAHAVEDHLRAGAVRDVGGGEVNHQFWNRKRERDLTGVDKEFERALANVENDPPAAVTAACSILEALFKVYIEDTPGLDMPSDQSLKPLWRTASKNLGLDPAQVEDDDVKKILFGLSSAVDGIGALRTHTGSAHGRGRNAYRLLARHARLAIHASHTLVTFFLETWDDRTQQAAP